MEKPCVLSLAHHKFLDDIAKNGDLDFVFLKNKESFNDAITAIKKTPSAVIINRYCWQPEWSEACAIIAKLWPETPILTLFAVNECDETSLNKLDEAILKPGDWPLNFSAFSKAKLKSILTLMAQAHQSRITN